MKNDRLESDNVTCKLQTGAQKWSNIQDVVAASTAFHKCILQVLGFILVKGSLLIDYAYRFLMTLHDIKGAPTTIKHLPPDKSNEGLGFRHAPNGNQKHEFEFRRGKILHMCKAASSVMLRQHEVPQSTYGC